MSQPDKGLRYNEGKTRYDLMEPYALEQLAKVFTEGAKKYAEHNWLRGMKWSKVLASMKRHIAAFENGEDYDLETGLHHMAHAAWNALALVSYQKHYPQGDDRWRAILHLPKIGLDVDEVLADWVHAWVDRWQMNFVPKSWFFDRNITEKFNQMRESGELDSFYLGLKPLIDPDQIPFEPHAYVTSRPVDVSITEQWLDKHGFPSRPVFTVELGKSKVDIIKEAGIEVFVDDRFDNFMELNKAGIFCYLYDAPHNQRYDVGSMRIKHLSELLKK